MLNVLQIAYYRNFEKIMIILNITFWYTCKKLLILNKCLWARKNWINKPLRSTIDLAENGILNIRYLCGRGVIIYLYTETNDDDEKSRNRAKKDESSALARACPQSLLNHGIVGRAESSESNSRGARTAENLQPRSIVESDAKERERIFPSHRAASWISFVRFPGAVECGEYY